MITIVNFKMYYEKYKTEMFDPFSQGVASHLEIASMHMRKHKLTNKSKLLVISPKHGPVPIFPMLANETTNLSDTQT